MPGYPAGSWTPPAGSQTPPDSSRPGPRLPPAGSLGLLSVCRGPDRVLTPPGRGFGGPHRPDWVPGAGWGPVSNFFESGWSEYSPRWDPARVWGPGQVLGCRAEAPSLALPGRSGGSWRRLSNWGPNSLIRPGQEVGQLASSSARGWEGSRPPQVQDPGVTQYNCSQVLGQEVWGWPGGV